MSGITINDEFVAPPGQLGNLIDGTLVRGAAITVPTLAARDAIDPSRLSVGQAVSVATPTLTKYRVASIVGSVVTYTTEASTGGFTTTTASFVQPAAVTGVVSVAVATTTGIAAGVALYIQGAGYYTAQSIIDATHVQCLNSGASGNAAVGSTIASGAIVQAAGPAGAPGAAGTNGTNGTNGAPGAAGTNGTNGAAGANAWSTLTASFVQPAVGATVDVAVASSAAYAVGLTAYVESGGYYACTAIIDATHVRLLNYGYGPNAAPAATVPTAGKVLASGPRGITNLSDPAITGILGSANGGGPVTFFPGFTTANNTPVVIATSAVVPALGVADVVASISAHDALGSLYRVDVTASYKWISGVLTAIVGPVPNGELTDLLGVSATSTVVNGNQIAFVATGSAATVTWNPSYFLATVG